MKPVPHLHACPFDASDLSEGLSVPTTAELAEMDRPGLRKPGEAPELSTLVLRHAGGSLGEVDVLEATPDGALHVRWRGAVGSAPYVLHTRRVRLPAFKGREDRPIAGKVEETEAPSECLLWKSNRAKTPLPWAALDAEGAKRLWRRMTGKKERVPTEEDLP